MEQYYKINNYIVNNYDVYNKNYENLCNVIEINNSNTIKDIEKIICNNNFDFKFSNILDLYYNMTTKDCDEITMIYDIKNNKDKENNFRILGCYFINNNMNKNLKYIYEDKEYDIFNFSLLNCNQDNDLIEIKLKGDFYNVSFEAMFENYY